MCLGLACGVLALVVVLVPLWTRPRPEARPAKSVVNERACTGCEQCMLDCPFDAITMVERTDGRAGMVARVNPDRCVSCGICIGSCAPMAIGPVGRTGRDQLALLRAFVERERPRARDVVAERTQRSRQHAGLRTRSLDDAHAAPVHALLELGLAAVPHALVEPARALAAAAVPRGAGDHQHAARATSQHCLDG